MKKLLFILLAAGFLAGCPKDPYTAAMQASLSVSDSVAQAIPIVQQLQTSNVLTPDETRSVYGYLQSVTVGNGVFRHTAQSLHASGQTKAAAYIAAADTFVKGVNSTQALAAIHITNPQSQAKVMLYLQAIDTVLNGIDTIIQNNTTTPTPAPAPTTGALLWTPLSSPA
jgi:hypothetical protein